MSDLNGQRVSYKGLAGGMKHTGVIVGKSRDGEWYHIKSDNPNAPKADWHFRIKATEIKTYLKV